MGLLDSITGTASGITQQVKNGVVSTVASKARAGASEVSKAIITGDASGLASNAKNTFNSIKNINVGNVIYGTASNIVSTAAGIAGKMVQDTITNFVDSIFGNFGTGTSNSSVMGKGKAEDFNVLKQTVKKLMRTDFQKEWLFKLEIEGEPSDFDLYVKDISYGSFEITVDEEQTGGVSMAWGTSRQCEKLSVTVRDHIDGRIHKFMSEWADKVVHKDGTVGLPYGVGGYVKKIKRYDIEEGGKKENLRDTWEMFPVQCGEISRSRENGAYMEFTVTFSVFSTGGISASLPSIPSSKTDASGKSILSTPDSNATKPETAQQQSAPSTSTTKQ